MFLYHRVPQGLEGTVLYPLNVLRDKFPHIYEQQARKYERRKALIETRIPGLDCLWNDVIFLSVLHPLRHRAIRKVSSLPPIDLYQSYRVPFEALDPTKTVIWSGTRFVHDPEEYLAYTRASVKHVRKTPAWQIQLWRDNYRFLGRLPLLFDGMPHVFYKGTLDVAGLKKTKL